MPVAFACATVRCLSWNVEGKEVLGLFHAYHIIAIDSHTITHHILCVVVQLSIFLPRLVATYSQNLSQPQGSSVRLPQAGHSFQYWLSISLLQRTSIRCRRYCRDAEFILSSHHAKSFGVSLHFLPAVIFEQELPKPYVSAKRRRKNGGRISHVSNVL